MKVLHSVVSKAMEPPKSGKSFQAKWDKNGDGKLSKYEADKHGMNHGGEVTVDGNNIDLTGLDASKLVPVTQKPGVFSYSTVDMFLDLPFETASTYGGSQFRNVNGKWQMQSQYYHYNLKSVSGIKDLFRNVMTIMGQPIPYPTLIPASPFSLLPVPTIGINRFSPFMINIVY